MLSEPALSRAEGKYDVLIISSPAGVARGHDFLPFSDAHLESVFVIAKKILQTPYKNSS
jgi:hypothetical protein